MGLKSVTLLSTFSRDEPLLTRADRPPKQKQNNHETAHGTTQNKATKHPTLAALRNTAETGRSLVALIRMAIAHGHPPWPPTPSPLAIIYYVGAYGLHKIMQ